jgi:hypothetical protein
VIGVLTFTVLASALLMGFALSGVEKPLPAGFNWEGAQLEHDFSLAERATELGVRVEIDLRAENGRCRAQFVSDGARPTALQVSLTHATQATLDRELTFASVGEEFACACAPVTDGAWYVTVTDAAQTWRVRELVRGNVGTLTLDARASSQ